MPKRTRRTKKPTRPNSPQRRTYAKGGLSETGQTNRTQYVQDDNSVDAFGRVNLGSWGEYAGGNVGTMIGLNASEGEDLLTDTVKVTAGYFTAGAGQIAGTTIHSGTLADANEAYYFNIAQTHPASASAETQFSVTFGHEGGSGSNTDSGNILGATQAIYGQWAATLLDETAVSGGFRISEGDDYVSTPISAALSARDQYIYILVGKRARFKDRINKKNWTIMLSGSKSVGGSGTGLLKLTDDSNTSAGVGTVAGTRYNIVSGTNGTISGSGASNRTYGWFYPEMGVMVFSGAELSASIPGEAGGQSMTASFDSKGTDASFISCSGFAPNISAAANTNNALRFINCLQDSGAQLKFRSEEDQISTSYFCRVRAKDLNFSNNPTFVSGSSNEIANADMWGNPNVYISGIGLYNASNTLVAIGKLSTPLKKNYSTESTIKVKLTY